MAAGRFEVFETAWGWMALGWRGARLCRVVLPGARGEVEREARRFGCPVVLGARSDLARACVRYFDGERVELRAPMEFPPVSPFRRRVWEVTARVPYGEVVTYGEVAVRAGCPGGARAVGGALARNPVPLVVPCHRVVSADGGLGGFSAVGGVETKRRLLALEGVVPAGGRRGGRPLR